MHQTDGYLMGTESTGILLRLVSGPLKALKTIALLRLILIYVAVVAVLIEKYKFETYKYITNRLLHFLKKGNLIA